MIELKVIEEAGWFEDLSPEKQAEYIDRHPNSKYAKQAKATKLIKPVTEPAKGKAAESRQLLSIYKKIDPKLRHKTRSQYGVKQHDITAKMPIKDFLKAAKEAGLQFHKHGNGDSRYTTWHGNHRITVSENTSRAGVKTTNIWQMHFTDDEITKNKSLQDQRRHDAANKAGKDPYEQEKREALEAKGRAAIARVLAKKVFVSRATESNGTGEIHWTKRGGHSGDAEVNKILTNAKKAGFKKAEATENNHPAGNWFSNTEVWKNKQGHELHLHRSIGETSRDNYWTATLKVS